MKSKSAFFFVLVAVYCCTPIRAQIRGYVEAGTNYSILSDCEYDAIPPRSGVKNHYTQNYSNDYGVQFAAGAFLQKSWFNYAVGMEYSTLNFGTNTQAKTDYQSFIYLQNNNFKSTLSYLSLPLTVETYASENRRVSIGGGIIPELLLDSKTSAPIDSKARKYGCSWQAQIKMQVTSRIAVIGVFRQSFTSIFDEGFMLSTSTRSRTARIAIRYIIGKKM